jgi:long-chain acyl-CoA synthetase
VYAAEHARSDPDKPAIVMATSGEVVTFAEYEAAANRVAQLLRDSGLRRRDHVAIFMNNDPRMLMSEGGAERTGLYYTCVNSYLSVEEVAYIVNDSESKVFMTSGAKADVALQLPALCPNVERWFMAGGRGDQGPFESWEEAIAGHPPDPIADEQLGTSMPYSSGTTGRPKGILRLLPDADPADNLRLLEGVRAMWRFREGMIYLSPAPLYHAAPQTSVALALRIGATTVVMEHFDAAQYLELVGRYRVTHSQVVPTMFSRLLKLPDDVRAGADVSSLEAIVKRGTCTSPTARAT